MLQRLDGALVYWSLEQRLLRCYILLFLDSWVTSAVADLHTVSTVLTVLHESSIV